MRLIVAPFVFLWNFIVGDQPWIALGVVMVAVLAAVLAGFSGGWLLVLMAVTLILVASLRTAFGFGGRSSGSSPP
ncbi:MAG: hypothetical protein MP439_10540 [Ferrimicrobium sp.]|nr:hypothetical protein [Ferrimicrobium sp.]